MSNEIIPAWAQRQLSKNFTLWELCRSETHPELVKPPSPAMLYWLKWWTDNVLQPLRNDFGRIRINSGYRCPKLNAAVGGEKESSHQIMIKGLFKTVATDIVPLDCPLADLFKGIAERSNKLPIRGAIIYPKRGFIHIDGRDGPAGFFVSVVNKVYIPISRKEAMKFKINHYLSPE